VGDALCNLGEWVMGERGAARKTRPESSQES